MRKLKKNKKSNKKLLYIIGGGLGVVLLLFVVANPFAIFEPDGGGSYYTTVPEAPTLYAIPSPNVDGSIELSWSKPTQTQGFRVLRYDAITDHYGVWTLIKTTSYTSYTDIIVDGYYTYAIQAYNTLGISPYSNERGVLVEAIPWYIPPLQPPSAPTLNTLQSPNLDGYIELSWSNPADTIGFDVFRSANGGSYTLFKTTTSTSYSFSESDGSYSYKIKAYNNDGSSDYSNTVAVQVSIYVPPIPQPPSAPTLNTLQSPNLDGYIELFWSNPPGTMGFEIFRSANGGSYVLFKTTASNSYWFSESDGSYSYKVKAYNNDGSSGYSNIVSVEVSIYAAPIPQPPNAPTLSQISPTVDYDGNVDLSWTNPTNTDNFRIYRSKDGFSFTEIKITGIILYTDTGLDSGVYRYKVIAHNSEGDSGYSNTVSVTVSIPIINLPPPTPPTPATTEISPIYYLLLIGGLGVGGFLIYRKLKKNNKKSKKR